MENHKKWKKEKDTWLKNADDETIEMIETFKEITSDYFKVENVVSEHVHHELCAGIIFEFQKKFGKEETKEEVKQAKRFKLEYEETKWILEESRARIERYEQEIRIKEALIKKNNEDLIHLRNKLIF